MAKNPAKLPICAVVGVGPGNGAAFARRFAADGYAVALLARSDELSRALAAELPNAAAFVCDVADAGSVETAFAAIRSSLGDPEVVIYNAGSGVFGTFDDATAADFETAWRVNTLGAFLVGKQVVPAMKQAGRGSIVFVGATASRRGGIKSASFAPA
jgi:NAD(P)-dependent dehydrogenase (short-subunit alcohol dehydrogenase family)